IESQCSRRLTLSGCTRQSGKSIHICMYIHTHANANAHTHKLTHSHTHRRMHTHTQIYVQQTHTHMRTHTHKLTYILTCTPLEIPYLPHTHSYAQYISNILKQTDTQTNTLILVHTV